MKKILTCFVAAMAALLLSGCDTYEVLSCTNTTNVNGFTTTTTYDIEYQDDDVKSLTITYDHKKNNTMDGVGTSTDGSAVDGDTTNDRAGEIDTDVNNNQDLNGDDIVDGVVGDAIDTAINTVTGTILDIAGIRDMHNNQVNSYANIDGLTTNVEVDTDEQYKIVYEIDYDTISDDDLTRFNADRSLNTLRSTYESQGLTCQ